MSSTCKELFNTKGNESDPGVLTHLFSKQDDVHLPEDKEIFQSIMNQALTECFQNPCMAELTLQANLPSYPCLTLTNTVVTHFISK